MSRKKIIKVGKSTFQIDQSVIDRFGERNIDIVSEAKKALEKALEKQEDQ